MKMSKVVKEYIRESVIAKYQSKIDALENERAEEHERLNNVIDSAKNEAAEFAWGLFCKNVRPLLKDGETTYTTNNVNVYFPSRWCECTEKESDLTKKIQATYEARDNKIKQILVELELGGTKEDLDRLLGSVDPDADEE